VSELQTEQVGVEDYGERESGRVFGLVHRFCELELGVTLRDIWTVDWVNPHDIYKPHFRLLDLRRTLRDDGSFHVRSFVLDIPGDVKVEVTDPDEDDLLVAYAGDILLQSIRNHVSDDSIKHERCIANRAPEAVRSVEYNAMIRRRRLELYGG
jgi:hypothetical protein